MVLAVVVSLSHDKVLSTSSVKFQVQPCREKS